MWWAACGWTNRLRISRWHWHWYPISTDRLIPDDLIAIGEIGLAGEVRAVNHIQNRVSEAYRLGFVRCMVPRHNLSQLNTEQMPDLEVIPVSSINEACKIIGRNKTE